MAGGVLVDMSPLEMAYDWSGAGPNVTTEDGVR